MSGLDKKETKNPILKSPNKNCIVPDRKANNIADWMYSSGPKILIVPNPAATRRESIATGPTASCFEVPSRA